MQVNSSFELDKLIKVFSYSQSKIIFLYDINSKDSSTMYNCLSSLVIPAEKLTSWSSISMMSINDSVFNINKVIESNIDADQNKNFYKTKFLIPKIKNKLHDIEISSNKTLSKNLNKHRFIIPVMSTLSTFGIALGVPLFSALLFRQNEIINGSDGKGQLGIPFFYGMISLAIILIILAISSMIVSLIFTIRQQRKEIANNLIVANYEKIINKYFYSENDKISNRAKRHKILIKHQYLIFFNNVSTTSQSYYDFLSFMRILNKLNCHVCLCFEESLTKEHINKMSHLMPDTELEYIDYKKYKTNFNAKLILNFILYQISLLTGLSSRLLISKYKSFANIIYRFLDASTTNTQLLEFLYTIKKLLGDNSSTLVPKKYIPYLIDLVTLGVYQILDPNSYEKTCNDIINYLDFSNESMNNQYFKFLNIINMFNKNLLIYKKQSLVFLLPSFLNNELSLKLIIENDEDLKNNISTTQPVIINNDSESIINAISKFKSNGFEQIEHSIEDVDFVFQKDDTFVYYKIYDSNTNVDNIFLSIKSFFEFINNKQVNYVMLNLFGNNILLQLFDSRYEIILDYFF